MIRHSIAPLIIGAAMGLMMLWMVHMQITNGDAGSLGVLIAFVGAHVAVLALVLVVPLLAARRLVWVRHLTDRVHRPSLRHVALMLGGATMATGTAHIVLHSGVI